MARPSPDPLFVLRCTKHPISCVKFAQRSSQQGDHVLLSGNTSGQVRIWDLSSRRWTACLDGHHGFGILAVERLNDQQIISQGRDGCLHSWDLSEGRQKIISSITVTTTNFCKVSIWQNQGHHIMAIPGDQMSEVRVISSSDQQSIARLKPPEDHKPLGMPMCVKFINHRNILIGYEDGTVALWDTSTNSILSERKVHSEPVMCLVCGESSQRGISGSTDEHLIYWKISPQSEISIEGDVSITNPGVADLALRSDHKILASGGWDSRIRVFGWKRMKPLAVLSYHADTVNTLDFSTWMEGSGHLLAAGSKDAHISVWSLYND